MTAAEVLTLAGKHVDDELVFDVCVDWLNEAQETLGADAGVFGINTVVASESTTFYNFAVSGHQPLDVLEVLDTDMELYTDFDVRAGQIRFADAGTYSVTYRRLPAEISASGQTLEGHALFKPALALFVASRFKSQDDDENPDAARLMNEFWSRVDRARVVLGRQARRTFTVKVMREASS